MGKTAVGIFTNNPAIAIEKTAITNQLSIITKDRNIIFTLLFIIIPEISAIVFPFSFTDITRAPKSCTAPKNIAPNTTQQKLEATPNKLQCKDLLLVQLRRLM